MMAYNTELYREIDRIYEQRREENMCDLERRKQAVFARIPKLEGIDDEIKSLGLKLYKIALNNADVKEEVAKLRSKQKELLELKKALLQENGYNEDELSERFHCSICRDYGVVDGKTCECYKKLLTEKAYELSNLSAQLTHQSFDTFDLSLYSEDVDDYYGVSPKEHMQRIVNDCKEFIKDFETTDKNLLFWGEPGLGKTFLSTCIAKELIETNHSVIYETAYKTFSMLEELKFKKTDNEDKLRFKVEKLYSCDLLILDDLGSEFATQYTTAALFDIINSRLISGKKTVINTNLTVDELSGKYGERVFSRMLGSYKMLEFIGKDIRSIKSVNN